MCEAGIVADEDDREPGPAQAPRDQAIAGCAHLALHVRGDGLAVDDPGRRAWSSLLFRLRQGGFSPRRNRAIFAERPAGCPRAAQNLN